MPHKAFKHALDNDFSVRPFATEPEIQSYIVKSFADPKGSVRVLISTI